MEHCVRQGSRFPYSERERMGKFCSLYSTEMADLITILSALETLWDSRSIVLDEGLDAHSEERKIRCGLR